MTTADCVSWQRLRSKVSGLDPREYAGLPTPVHEAPLVMAEGHPWHDRLHGFCLDPEKNQKHKLHAAQNENDGVEVLNTWHDWRGRRDVYVWREPASRGKSRCATLPAGPMQRARKMIECVGVATTMDVDAEERALALLKTLIAPHMFNTYRLVGSFLETSKRSNVTYQFRRLGTTIAWGFGHEQATGTMRFLCALCLHPIAYYDGLPMGAMVPTDDVIAHLVMMRADEHLFWRKSNQHNSFSPGAML